MDIAVSSAKGIKDEVMSALLLGYEKKVKNGYFNNASYHNVVLTEQES